MDDRQFDGITKLVASSSRRRIVQAFAGGAVAAALGVVGRRAPVAAVDKVTICHKPGTPAQKTLNVPPSAVPGHLDHGDYVSPEGCCPTDRPGCIDAGGNATCCDDPNVCVDGQCVPSTCDGVTCLPTENCCMHFGYFGDLICTNPNTDRFNCGACGDAEPTDPHRCNNFEECVAGTCSCVTGTPWCCPSNQAPVAGACPEPEEDRGCTDLSSDRHNCGACGNSCPGTCSNGACV